MVISRALLDQPSSLNRKSLDGDSQRIGPSRLCGRWDGDFDKPVTRIGGFPRVDVCGWAVAARYCWRRGLFHSLSCDLAGFESGSNSMHIQRRGAMSAIRWGVLLFLLMPGLLSAQQANLGGIWKRSWSIGGALYNGIDRPSRTECAATKTAYNTTTIRSS